ncbi:MAG TPA: BrnT family toxin [Candidatus Acetothermia bacterium]|nr:BrnT family toxin [Candidatus Acetothermia bacterium]
MGLLFEWDPKKAQLNIKRHKMSFDEASTAFRDPLSRTIDDPLHSDDEERSVLIGQSIRGCLLVVVHIERGDRIRIISARLATNKERSRYEENEE